MRGERLHFAAALPSCTAAYACVRIKKNSIGLIFTKFNFDTSALGRTDWKFPPINNFRLYGMSELGGSGYIHVHVYVTVHVID